MPRACAPTSIRTGVCSFFSPGNAKENIPESVSSNSISFSASQVRIVSRCWVFASACCDILVLPHHECGLPLELQGAISGPIPGEVVGLLEGAGGKVLEQMRVADDLATRTSPAGRVGA